MADFVAVLKKTIDGLGDASPVMRERVYEKARTTVAAKLAAINPPPPAAVAERQKKSLEDAIREIEAQYLASSTPADPLDELEDVFSALDGSKPVEAAPASTPGSSFEVKPIAPAAPASHVAAPSPVKAAPASMDTPEIEPRPDFKEEADSDDDTYDDFDEAAPRKRGIGGIVAALVVLALLGGGGYAAWLNKDDLSAMLGLNKTETAAPKPAETATPPEKPAVDSAAATPPAETTAPAETPAQPEKFTQRLNADGTEVDQGPASGTPTIGEGTSVATATQPPEPVAPTTDPSAPATDPGAPAAVDPATPASPPPATGAPAAGQAVAVGQKAIFYEERTNVAQGSADTGSIVWSVVQESPGGDLPPEPAIRAEATIPGKNLQLRMTIRRNGDPTLPASHIIEMIFLTPEGFEGGGIENILRVSLKDTEQSAGNALLGIPAKIADGFFLVALTDTKAEIDANLNLLRRDQWIDVPLVYKSGRRALITMEKGIPGEKVFDETMKAWEAKAAGSAG
ncbi:MAG: hypothetical protein ABWZ83_10190 [Mesorhizobium sp.]